MQKSLTTRLAAVMIVVGMAAPAFRFLLPTTAGASRPARVAAPTVVASTHGAPEPVAIALGPESASAASVLAVTAAALPEGYAEAHRTQAGGASPWDVVSGVDCDAFVDLPAPKAQDSALHVSGLGGAPVVGITAAVFADEVEAETAAGSVDGQNPAGRCWHRALVAGFIGDVDGRLDDVHLADSRSRTETVCACDRPATVVVHRYVVDTGAADQAALTVYLTALQVGQQVVLVTTHTPAEPNTAAEVRIRTDLLEAAARALLEDGHSAGASGSAPRDGASERGATVQ